MICLELKLSHNPLKPLSGNTTIKKLVAKLI